MEETLYKAFYNSDESPSSDAEQAPVDEPVRPVHGGKTIRRPSADADPEAEAGAEGVAEVKGNGKDEDKTETKPNDNANANANANVKEKKKKKREEIEPETKSKSKPKPKESDHSEHKGGDIAKPSSEKSLTENPVYYLSTSLVGELAEKNRVRVIISNKKVFLSHDDFFGYLGLPGEAKKYKLDNCDYIEMVNYDHTRKKAIAIKKACWLAIRLSEKYPAIAKGEPFQAFKKMKALMEKDNFSIWQILEDRPAKDVPVLVKKTRAPAKPRSTSNSKSEKKEKEKEKERRKEKDEKHKKNKKKKKQEKHNKTALEDDDSSSSFSEDSSEEDDDESSSSSSDDNVSKHSIPAKKHKKSSSSPPDMSQKTIRKYVEQTAMLQTIASGLNKHFIKKLKSEK